MIAMYDLNDEFLEYFDNYKECSNYFDCSIESLYSHISRTQKGKVKKKRDKKNKRWVKLFKIGDE